MPIGYSIMEGAIKNSIPGIDGMWGLRAENAELSIPIAEKLGNMVRDADSEVVAGDCHLANTAITEQTGETPLHPLEVIAKAYGFKPEATKPKGGKSK